MNELFPISGDQLVNILYSAYYFFRDLIMKLFEYTIFKGVPSLSIAYGDAFTILISLTSVYMVLELFAWGKKIIRLILAIGWILLVVSILAGTLA